MRAGVRSREHILAGALFLATLAVYVNTLTFDFVNLDDPHYIVNHSVIREGITAEGLGWIATQVHLGNWHPLASFSHMLDCELFGLNPAGHHFTSVLLHSVNTALLFLVLASMTSHVWPAALAAGLFGLHPLHVESVAWISQRKDVLSMLFGLLTVAAYIRFARKPVVPRYLPVVGLYTLALLSKGMLVTLPFVLLLLDYWPLRRFARDEDSPYKGEKPQDLVIEKFPLFALAAVLSFVTFRVQSAPGTMTSLDSVTLFARISNAADAYTTYLLHTIWPFGLIPFYPHPGQAIDVASTVVNVFLLSFFTFGACWYCRRYPYLLVGWLWYLGTLVPVIGLVQVGSQGMADRYTYFPLVGIFVLVSWGLSDIASNRARIRLALSWAVPMVIILLAALSWIQANHWKDSESLWRHSLRYRADNAFPHLMLGYALVDKKAFDEAEVVLGRARDLSENPKSRHWAEFSLGRVDFEQGRPAEAEAHFRETLRLFPEAQGVDFYLGKCLLERGAVAEAKEYLDKALATDSSSGEAHLPLGLAISALGDIEGALPHFLKAVDHDPSNPLAYANLGSAMLRLGRESEALTAFERALELMKNEHPNRTQVQSAVIELRERLEK